jgi:hypothetical protein
MKSRQTYRFTIVNLYKPSSLYNAGMQPLMYSDKKAEYHHIGWRRVGFNIKYFRTDIRRLDTNSEQYYYGLTWSYTFTHDDDVCYFAHCYPYTYSDLQEYLYSIATDPVKSKVCKQRTLCHTIAGNPVPLLTITSPSISPNEAQTKKAVIVTARVHPGETNSSWMMKGLIDLLTSDTPDSEILRDAFVFKIIPMLNPDGVIVGNYRCSLAGRDLNRNYKTKLPEAYPTVWYTKELVKKISEERNVALYCDFHGHSRKQNVFIYGCDNVQDPDTRLCSRVFPMMLSKNAPDKFNYKSCNFKVQKTKEGTGRVFMWKEMNILNSFTMEATFCGSNIGKNKGYHFSTKDLEEMAYHFCDTLLDYFDPDQTKAQCILNDLLDEYRESLLSKLAAFGVIVPEGVDPLSIAFDSDLYAELDSSDAGSDSSESDGPPVLGKYQSKKKRNKKLQTRKERNKQKARIKLTHKINQQTPQHLLAKQTSNSDNSNKADIPQSTSSISSILKYRQSSLASIDGKDGIPKYVSERMIEKEKKSGSLLQDDYKSKYNIEMVTAEYARHGLPYNSLLDANKELVSSTASLLSQQTRSQCPIAITPKILQDPSQTKINSSRTTLPQLPCISSSSGTFTSRYVVSRIEQDGEEGTKIEQQERLPQQHNVMAGNTHNLVSLSRLFRQLKPHILGSQKDVRSLSYNDNGVVSSSSSQNIMKSISKQKQQYPHSSSSITVPNNDEEQTVKCISPPLTAVDNLPKSNLTRNDLSAVNEIRQSYTSLLDAHQNFSTTNPMLSGSKKNELNLLHLSQPPVTALSWNNSSLDTARSLTKLDTKKLKKEADIDVDNQLYSNRDVTGGSIDGSNALEHKHQVANAVETLQQRKKKLFKNSLTNISMETYSHNEFPLIETNNNTQNNINHHHTDTDVHTNSNFPYYQLNTSQFATTSTNQSDPQISPPHAQTTSSCYTQNVHAHQTTFRPHTQANYRPHTQTNYRPHTQTNHRPHTQTTSRPQTKNSSRLHTQTSSYRHTHSNLSQIPRVHSRNSHYRIYSNNPQQVGSSTNNRYVPSTVSLMLSSNNPRPVSQHRPKPLQLRYYSNQRRESYF